MAGCIALFFAALILWALIVLRTVVSLFPIRPGIYRMDSGAWIPVLWEALTFVRATLLPIDALIPFPLRVPFSQMLGLRVPSGRIALAGYVGDPYLVSIGGGTRVGCEALLLPHIALANDVLILAPIKIGKGALVGTRSIVLPGVTIGDNAMVNAMSVVPMHTNIGPGEVWGGNPARRLGPPATNDSAQGTAAAVAAPTGARPSPTAAPSFVQS